MLPATLPNWVRSARPLPLAFAQVREDPALDRAMLDRFPHPARVLMIASGGCTAAHLAASGRVKALELVDPNPAQLALARVKLHLLQHSETPVRLELLGHTPLSAAERGARLHSLLKTLVLPPDALGDPPSVAELGPDHAGRYERVFAALREELQPHAATLTTLLNSSDLAVQSAAVHPETEFGAALDRALDTTMSLPVLVHLFGAEATNNPVEPFARHFARRIRHALATLPARTNPFLWQMLHGTYPRETLAPWLTESASRLPEIQFTQAFMLDALRRPRQPQDFVHLSNILDWLTPDAARETLAAAWKTLRPGGVVLIRQLNSTLDIPALGPAFDWRRAEAATLHDRDRSFFYRHLHLGLKPE